jgi:porphobilinogen deaminase
MEAETERLLIKELHADCDSPTGAHASIHGRILILRAIFALDLEGEVVWGEIRGPCEKRDSMAKLLADGMMEELCNPGRARYGRTVSELRIRRGKSL